MLSNSSDSRSAKTLSSSSATTPLNAKPALTPSPKSLVRSTENEAPSSPPNLSSLSQFTSTSPPTSKARAAEVMKTTVNKERTSTDNFFTKTPSSYFK